MMAQGLPLVIVMPGLIYGPGDTSMMRSIFTQYLKRKLPMIPTVSAYSWGYVDDIARAHILAMERGNAGESYIIAGSSHTLVEMMDLAAQITGVPTPRHVAPGLLRMASGVMGVVEKVVPVPDEYSSEYLRISAGVTYLGTAKKAELAWGYHPRSLEEGLAKTLPYEMSLLGMTPPPARQDR
jgi:nucleoside-diphosphate-sugar epimerase